MTRTINICVDDRFAERKSAGDWPLFHGLSMGPMCVRTGAIIEWTDDFPPPDGISIKVSIYLHSIRRGKFLPF